MLKNSSHELQNQLPRLGPFGISLNVRHVAANRIVIPITPTCTDAVLCERRRQVCYGALLITGSSKRGSATYNAGVVSVLSSATRAAAGTNLKAQVVTVSRRRGPRICTGNGFR
jgi:hypothetical protein